MSTANVVVSRSGTSWTVDVTACNLSTDLTLKDFVVLQAGSLVGNTNYTKTTPTVLTYTGVSLGTTTIEVRRKTPDTPIQIVAFAQRFSSGDFNNEVDRVTRRAEEYSLNGIGPGSILSVATPLDTPFGVSWDGNIVNPPTMNAVYDQLILLAPLANPTFTGTITIPTVTLSDNSTKAASTAFVQGNLASYAPLASPTFSGNPTAPTQTLTDNSTKLANTAFVTGADKSGAGGRLTSTTGVPVPTTPVTTVSTIYYTPYIHNHVRLYNGTLWKDYTFTEVSLALSGLTSGKNYDVFLYDNASVLTLELSAAWTNDTTRADAVSLQNGTLVKTSANTRRLVGTIRATGATSTTDTLAKRFVASYDNRVSRRLLKNYTGANYAYTTAAWRQANGSAAEQVEFVQSVSGAVSVKKFVQMSSMTTALTNAFMSIGLDAVSSGATQYVGVGTMANHSAGTVSFVTQILEFVADDLAAGYHFLTSSEFGGAGCNFAGTGGPDTIVNSLYGLVLS